MKHSSPGRTSHAYYFRGKFHLGDLDHAQPAVLIAGPKPVRLGQVGNRKFLNFSLDVNASDGSPFAFRERQRTERSQLRAKDTSEGGLPGVSGSKPSIRPFLGRAAAGL